MESTHQEAFGRIEYGNIDVIGHRLGIKTQLEHIQVVTVRKTIKNVINGQINELIKNGQANFDDIQGSAGLIRDMIMAYVETPTFKTMVRVDIGIDWETFQRELEAAIVDGLLTQAILNVLHGHEAEEVIQEGPSNRLPHEELVNDCAKSIIQSRLLRGFLRVLEKGGRRLELYMHEPLAAIFSEIQKVNPTDRPSEITRTIIHSETAGHFRHDDHTLNDLEHAPDFSILDVSQSTPLHGPIFYRQIASFVEVRGSDRDGPTPRRLSSDGYNDKLIVNHNVDYASLIMSARPFNVFSIGLIIHGTKFTVMYADHSGVCFSPEYSFKDSDHFRLFICIMIRLLFYMNDDDMGKDPTVTITKGSYYSEEYPEFLVKLGDSNETRTWSTYGHPLFVSRSIFCRGSSIWKAVGFNKEHCVLKCAWRAKARIHTESSIYNQIGPHHGVAHWLDGDDVKLNNTPLTTRFLRNRKDNLFNSQLHRVAIKPVGKPLWEFGTVLELFLGFRSALEGHQYMFEEKKILHRDVSAGNILLCDDTHPPHSHVRHGFLMDPELALVINPDTPTIAVDIDPPRNRYPVLPLAEGRQTIFRVGTSGPKTAGPPITGTAQFMAIEVLRAVIRGNSRFPRQVHHDLESFIWVFHYALYMHVFQVYKEKGVLHDELTTEFKLIFGVLDIKIMNGNRTSDDHTYLPALADALFSLGHAVLFQLNKDFTEFRRQQVPRRGLKGFSSITSWEDTQGDLDTAWDAQTAATTNQSMLIDIPPDTTALITYAKLQRILSSAIHVVINRSSKK